MTQDDIRRKTALIIRKNGVYLQGREYGGGPLVWSRDKYDAWKTRDRETARFVARVTGGIVVLFNPIVGRTMEL